MPLLRSFIGHPIEHEPNSQLRDEGRLIDASNLAQALGEASRILAVRFEPHEPPKWFRAFGIPNLGDSYMLVDVHIKRHGVELCPKQDLAFPIIETDVVCIFMVTC